MTTNPTKKKIPKAVKIILWICGSIIAFVILIAIFAPDHTAVSKEDTSVLKAISKDTQSVLSVSTKEKENDTEKIENKKIAKYVLIENLDEFKNRFNELSTEMDLNLKITGLSVTDGAVNNTFKYMLTDYIGIVGQLNKDDNSIRSLLLTAHGDGTAESGVNIVATIGCLINCANPELTAKGRGNILKHLGLFDEDADFNNLDRHTIVNGVKYSISSNKIMGLLFSINRSVDE